MGQIINKMKLQWLFVCVWLNLFYLGTSSLNYETITCTPASKPQLHLVPEKTIIHFTTPNTAENWLKHSWSSHRSPFTCNERFLAANNNSKLWAAVFNGDRFYIFSNGEEHYYQRHYYFSNSNSVNFFAGSSAEGVAFSYDPTTADCPFSNSVIEMKEDTVIPITSSIKTTNKSKKCIWKFSINHRTQKLKVFKEAIERYRVLNDNNYYNKCIKEISSEINGENQILTFQNIKDKCTVFVSVVQKHPKYTITECKHKIINDSVVQVFNSEDGNSYGPYEKCEYIINIPTNHVVHIKENYILLDYENDLLLLEEPSGKQINATGNIFLNENANGTILKFQTDGNIQKLGFNLTLETIKKECSESEIIVPCDVNKRKTFTPFVVPENWYLYKGMQCNYTLKLEEACNAYSYSIKVFGNGNSLNATEEGTVTLEIFEDKKLIKKITPQEKRMENDSTYWIFNFEEQFLSNKIITLKLAISETKNNIYPQGSFLISASSNGPLITSPIIYLNKTFNAYPVALNDVNANNLITVCVEDANDDLEIFIAAAYKYDDDGFYLYDSAGISNVTKKLDESSSSISNILRYQKFSSGCFTLHRFMMSIIEGKVLYKLKQATQNNYKACNDFHNIFVVPNYVENITIFNNASEPCETFLIFLNDNNMKKLSNFNASPNSTFTIQTVKEKIEFFKISSEDAHLWKDVQISTQFLSIQMSPMSKRSFAAEIDWHRLIVIDKPTKGMFYAGKYAYMNPHEIIAKSKFNITLSYNYGDVSCKWKIVAITNERTSTFFLNLNSTASAIGEEFIVENECNDEMHPNVYIEYFAQAIPSTQSSQIQTSKNQGKKRNQTMSSNISGVSAFVFN